MIHFLETYEKANIHIQRDDLLPFSFGGNKVRIAGELFEDLQEKHKTAVVTYGSPGSNMNRALAHMAKQKGIPCYCIIKRDGENGFFYNERLVRESGARIVSCTRETVRETVASVLRLSESRGERPYYIYGDADGHGNEEVLMRASGKLSWPIREYESEHDCHFKHFFLPVGTGATISGLCAAVAERYEVEGEKIQIHGISIGRRKNTAEAAVYGFLNSCGYSREDAEGILDITDAYLGDGYGSDSLPVRQLIRRLMAEHGVPMDPVYTGKAYYGMLQEISRQQITGDVLFFHTGGLPLYFDMLGAENGGDCT